MKRAIKVLLAILLATVMVVAVAACTPTEKDPCANGHSWDDGQKVTADCTQSGKLVRHCKVCGASWETDLAAGEHTWGEYKVTKAPTCTEDGIETRTCSVCGKTEDQTITSDGHVWGEYKVTKAPTCTEDGLETRTCSVCGETDQKTLPAAHSWGEVTVTKAPTCKQPGIGSAQCTVCGEHSDSIEIPATGIHSWNDGSVTKAPDCETAGVLTYTCTVCGDTTTQSLPANGHTYGRLIPQADATCTENGTKAHYQCSVCGKLFDEFKTSVSASDLVIRSTGHSLSERQAKAATCTEEGYEAYYQCRRCNELFADDAASQPIDAPVATPKADHTPQPYGAKAATCTQQGATAGSKCAVCGKILITPKATPALGHEFYYVEHDEQETHTERCRRCDHSVEQACIPDTQWAANDDYHWHTCLLCDGEVDRAVHSTEAGSKQCTICGREIGEVVVRVDGADDKICTSVKTAIEYISETYPNGDVTATIVINADRDGDGVTIEGNIHVVIDLSNLVYKISKGTTIVGGQADVTFTNGTVDGKITYKGGTLRFSEVDSTKLIIDMNGATCDDAEIYFDGVLRTHSAVEGWQVDETARKHYHVCAYCSARIDEAACVTENKYDNSDHWSECTTCHEKYDLAGHTMAYQNTAPGTHKHYCTECDYVDESDTACTPDSGENNGLHSDENDHWYVCASCKTEYGRSTHNYGKFVHDSNAKTHTRICEDCGREDTAQCSNLEQKSNDTQHWNECPLCNERYDVASHVWKYDEDADGYHLKSCTQCSVEAVREQCVAKVPADNHDIDHRLNVADGWYADADSHWKVCKDCGQLLERGEHSFDKQQSGERCKVCGHKFFDVKISDGNGLDQSVPTIAEAFAWIKDNGDESTTYTVTLTHNRSDTSSKTVTVPAGFNIVLDLASHSVDYRNGALAITSGSLEVKNGAFNIGKILYGGGTLKLPAGEYKFEITDTTCDKADITVDGQHLEHKYPDSWVKKSDTEHKRNCEFCGYEDSEGHTWDSAWTYDDGKLTHTRSCKCVDSQTGKNLAETKECESEVKVVDGVSKNVCKTCGKELPTDDIIAKLNSLYQDEDVTESTYLSGTYILTGVITRVDGTNVYINVSGDTQKLNLECYKINLNGKNASDLIVGAKLTVQGTLMCFVNYNTNAKTLEFQEGCKLIEIDKNVSYKVSFESEYFELTDSKDVALQSEYLVGTTVIFKVKEINAQKVVGTVTVNDELVEPNEDGEYSFEIHGDVTIVVAAVDWDPEAKVETKVAHLSFEEAVNGKDPNLSSTTAYTSNIQVTRTQADGSSLTWDLTHFNNNKTSATGTPWDHVRAGRKNNKENMPSDAYISVQLSAPIVQIIVAIGFPNNSNDFTHQMAIDHTTVKLIVATKVTVGSGGVITEIAKENIIEEQTVTLKELADGALYNEYSVSFDASKQAEHQGEKLYYVLHVYTDGTQSKNGYISVYSMDYFGLKSIECSHPDAFRKSFDAKSATCEKDGNKAYSQCERCGQLFNESGEKTTMKDITEPALGHLFEKDTYQKDSTGHWQECTRANCDAEKGKRFNESDHDKGLYHSDDTYHWRYCETCGWEEEHTSLGNDNKHNTNGEAGACDVCGYGAKNFTIEGGDSYDDFAEVVEALQTISRNVTVKVNKALDGDITYTGEINTNGHNVTLNAQVFAIKFANAITINGNVTLQGRINAASILVGGELTLAGTHEIGTLTVVGTKLTMTGDVTITSGLTITTGTAETTNKLNAEKATVTVSRDFTIKGTATIGTLSQQNGTVTVGATEATTSLTVGTISVYCGTLDFKGSNVTVTNGIELNVETLSVKLTQTNGTDAAFICPSLTLKVTKAKVGNLTVDIQTVPTKVTIEDTSEGSHATCDDLKSQVTLAGKPIEHFYSEGTCKYCGEAEPKEEATWTLVKNAKDLEDGDQLIFAYAPTGGNLRIMNNKIGTKIQTDETSIATGTQNLTEIPDSAAIFTLGVLSGGKYTLLIGNNYLAYSSSTDFKTEAKGASNPSNSAQWTLNSSLYFVNVNTPGRGILIQVYTTSSGVTTYQYRFGAYSTGNASNKDYAIPAIYRLSSGTDVGGGDVEPGGGDTPEEKYGTADAPLTVAQVIALAKTLGNNIYTPQPVYVKGTVDGGKDGTGSPSQSSSGEWMFCIKDDSTTEKFLVYNATLSSSLGSTLSNGDVVVVSGYLTYYNGNTPELYQHNSTKPQILSLESTGGGGSGGGETEEITVTIDCSAISSVADITEQGIHITSDLGTNENNQKPAKSSGQFRLYANNTITITAPSGKNLVSVEFICSSSNYCMTLTITNGGGSYSKSDSTGTWKGDVNSVTLKADSSGQHRIKTIIVKYK